MFKNMGKKIKWMSKILCWLGIAASVLVAVSFWAQHRSYNPTIGTGFIVLFAGCFVSWIGSFFSYGFGELVDYACQELSRNPQCEQLKFEQLKFDKWQCSQCGAINSGSTCSKCSKKKSIFDHKCA